MPDRPPSGEADTDFSRIIQVIPGIPGGLGCVDRIPTVLISLGPAAQSDVIHSESVLLQPTNAERDERGAVEFPLCVREVVAYIGTEPLGARIVDSGSIRTSVQGSDSGAAVAAGELGDRAGFA